MFNFKERKEIHYKRITFPNNDYIKINNVYNL